VQPVYAVGAEKDHIVPWDAAWRITQLLGENVRFVLVSSGHIAGIINPPGGKGTYWTTKSNTENVSAEEWRKTATRYDGTWWTDWPHGSRSTPARNGSCLPRRRQPSILCNALRAATC